jgi:hypothetical protein
VRACAGALAPGSAANPDLIRGANAVHLIRDNGGKPVGPAYGDIMSDFIVVLDSIRKRQVNNREVTMLDGVKIRTFPG